MDLSRLLSPRSVAVVGATDRPGSYGAQALINLEAIGYPGAVYGVNPGRAEALGRACVPSIADLPEPVDAVVIAIPADGVPAAIDEAGARACGGAVVLSAGFGEIAGGAALDAELVAAAHRHAFPVCGPNCNGIVAMHARAALWGDALAPREPGHVALISQSGNVAVNALATRRGLRFHTVVASGNQSVLSATNYLETLAREDGVRAVAMYLEDDAGPGLCEGLAVAADNGVRVAVLKVGSSAAGAAAATAHSGALVGDQRVFRALIEEAGGVWAADVHELFEFAKALAAVRRLPARNTGRANGVAILTCSGGDSAQAADEADRVGISLPALAPATTRRLAELLPPAATVANPLDYTAMIWGDVDALSELVFTVGGDPAVDDVLIFYDQPPDLEGAIEESWRAVREGVIAGAARTDANVIVSSTLPELLDDAAAWRFCTHGIPAVAGLRTGVAATRALGSVPGDPARIRAIGAAATAASNGGGWLSEHASKELLRAGGVRVVDGRLATDADDAVAAHAALGGRVAVKVSAASVQHKSDLGGVDVGVSTEAAVRDSYARLSALAAEHGGDVLVEEMAEPGVELLVAARRDPIASVLIIGLGGIWTELLDDVVVVPLPADAPRIERALRSLRGAALLSGGRGREPVDLAAATRLIERCGQLLIEQRLELIELNPLCLTPRDAVAVDATLRRR